MRDVVVIGAGPAGSTAARLLADGGHDVLILEEHDEVGTPVHCTGLLGSEAFDEFDLPRSLELARTDAARFWSGGGRSVPLRSDRVNAAVIDRGALDRHLADCAVAAGADLRTGCRAEHVEVDPAGVTVVVRGAEPLRARAVVLACGASYRFHRRLGLGLPGVFLQSAQIDTAWPAMPGIEVQFGREVAPSGFAWIVPFTRDGEPRARIGLMSETRSAERFAAFVDSLARRAGIDPVRVPAPRQKMLPLGPVRRSYADRVLAVGDAAGLVKPTTGGGIYYGMLSGVFAAQVLGDALRRDRLGARVLRQYEHRWRQRLGQEIRVGLAFRSIATRLSDESIDELIDLAGAGTVAPLIERTASFNWHRRAAIALLGHPSVRRIVFRTWARSAGSI
ncbi:MAG: NAD(P)/FAD-dependent oxidoreductase [Acidobacteriota bacterium]